jgi:hypothetical protein
MVPVYYTISNEMADYIITNLKQLHLGPNNTLLLKKSKEIKWGINLSTLPNEDALD